MKIKSARVMGHRGVPSLAPENTLAGFVKAIEVGARWVELDVTLLGDLTPVVHHDDSLDRCSDRHGLLSQLSAQDLKGINNTMLYPHYPAEPVPLLSDVLALLSQQGIGLNLEIKRYGVAPEVISRIVIDALRQDFHSEKLVISSFDTEVLIECQRYAPDIYRGLICNKLPRYWQRMAAELGLISLHCNGRYLTQAQAAEIKAQGYLLFCWTINDPIQAALLWRWGVDGLITDRMQDFSRYYAVE